MTSGSAPSLPLDGPRARTKAVHGPTVVAHVQMLYRAKRSFRRIAREDFGGRVSIGVLSRLVKEIEPRETSIRLALGLPPLSEIEAAAGVIVYPRALALRSSRRCQCGCDQEFIPGSAGQLYLRGHRKHRRTVAVPDPTRTGPPSEAAP